MSSELACFIILAAFLLFCAAWFGFSLALYFHMKFTMKKNNVDAHFNLLIRLLTFDDIARIKERIRRRDKTK